MTRNAFISYSWDDDFHRSWVRSLAERPRADGVDVTLDQLEAVPRDQLPAFMEGAIRENEVIVIICSPATRVAQTHERVGADTRVTSCLRRSWVQRTTASSFRSWEAASGLSHPRRGLQASTALTFRAIYTRSGTRRTSFVHY